MDYLLSSKSPGFVSTRRLCRARGSITVVVYMVLLQSEAVPFERGGAGKYVAMDRYRCRARASRTFILTGESGRTGMALLFPCFNFIVCSVLFFFSHCAVYLQGLFGSRPSRQFIGQAEISAPDDQNRTPGSAV